MRRRLMLGGFGVATCLFAAANPVRGADPALDEVLPVRVGDTLAADLRTSGLPGARLESSVASGLPSAIELHLEALDRKNRRVAESDLFWRITWDLWDEVLRIDGPDREQRFDNLAALDGFLSDLRHLPVASWGALDVSAAHRLRARCRLHPVAPLETERLSRWVAGQERRGDADGREVSVGLSDVIRFFYKGASRDADELDERFSAWFVPSLLPDLAAPSAEAAP